MGDRSNVADANVAGIHGVTAQLWLGDRDVATHEVPPGEAAKTMAVLERLWRAMRVGRDGTIVGLGGGCATDLAGFAAATYMRGVDWVAVPTSLVGQVDAAIGGKTAVDLPEGKNLVGAFHWPARVIIDPGVLETLPARERANGMAEAVKTGLLAGEPELELPEHEAGHPCAAYKAGEFSPIPTIAARATSSISGTRSLTHWRQQPDTGCRTARRWRSAWSPRSGSRGTRKGLPSSGRCSRRNPVRVDRDAAWTALARDKKARAGSPRLVLLEPGAAPRWALRFPPATCGRRSTTSSRIELTGSAGYLV